MVYFAYGFPAQYRLSSTQESNRDEEEVVSSQWSTDLLLIVTKRNIHIWSGGQHRVKLGWLERKKEDVGTYGWHKDVAWLPSRKLLAVTTVKGYLLYYSYRPKGNLSWSDPKLPCMDVYMQKSVQVSNDEEIMSAFAVVGLCCDAHYVSVGLRSGDFHTYSWSGELQHTSSPLEHISIKDRQVSTDVDGSRLSSFQPVVMDFVRDMSYSAFSRILVLAFENGCVAAIQLGSEGLSELSSIAAFRWAHICRAAKDAAAKVSLQPGGGMLAIGLENSRVCIVRASDLFGLEPSEGQDKLPGCQKAFRMLSMNNWGHSSTSLGPISVLSWSFDGKAIAVGYERKGLSIWTPLGCKIFSTLSQGNGVSEYHQHPLSPTSPTGPFSVRSNHSSLVNRTSSRRSDGLHLASPIDSDGMSGPQKEGLFQGRISSISWSVDGGSLFVQQDNLGTFFEISFAKCIGNHVVNVSDAPSQRTSSQVISPGKSNFVLVGSDRLLLISQCPEKVIQQGMHGFGRSSDADNLDESPQVSTRHVKVPQQYLDNAYPVKKASISFSGNDVAIAGSKGIAVYQSLINKWRLFGDVSQEKKIKVHHLKWLSDDVILACAEEYTENMGKPKCSILFFPKAHLDLSSVLGRCDLGSIPINIDVSHGKICIVSSASTVSILEVTFIKEQKLQNTIATRLEHELKLDNAFSSWNRIKSVSLLSSRQTKSILPFECLVLREDGRLSSVSLVDCKETELAGGVEYFWLPQIPLDIASDIKASYSNYNRIVEAQVEIPWWTYGSGGMRLWFPSQQDSSAFVNEPDPLDLIDPELEFDQEVLPIGISLSEVSIIGITQRTRRNPLFDAHSASGIVFYPLPESQPVLACLLRRLLSQGKFKDALALADLYSSRPNFSRSLEWLLFTSLDSNSLHQKRRRANCNEAGAELVRAAELVLRFPHAAELVVSVARKTDAELWPALFQAAGSPAALCDGLLRDGLLQSAACCLVVVAEMLGPGVAYGLALRTLKAAINIGKYDLCADLLRFLTPDKEPNEFESSRKDQNLIKSGESKASGTANRETSESYRSWILGWFSWGNDNAGPSGQSKSDAEFVVRRRYSEEDVTRDLHDAILKSLHAEIVALEPHISAWRVLAKHGWKLLDSGAVRDLASLNRAMHHLHGGLAALLSTTKEITPTALGHTTPSASSIASALFIASNEFATARQDEWESADGLMESLIKAGAVNYAVGLAIVLGNESFLETFRSQHPKVWTLLQDLISNDVHLCSFSALVTPPSPLLL